MPFVGRFRWTASTSLEIVVCEPSTIYSIIFWSMKHDVVGPKWLWAISTLQLYCSWQSNIVTSENGQCSLPQWFLGIFGWSWWSFSSRARPHNCAAVNVVHAGAVLSKSGKAWSIPNSEWWFFESPHKIWISLSMYGWFSWFFMTVYTIAVYIVYKNISRLMHMTFSQHFYKRYFR